MTETKLCDRECVACGSVMWRRTEQASCDQPGCCVLHYAEVVRCPECGGTVYSYVQGVPSDGADQ